MQTEGSFLVTHSATSFEPPYIISKHWFNSDTLVHTFSEAGRMDSVTASRAVKSVTQTCSLTLVYR